MIQKKQTKKNANFRLERARTGDRRGAVQHGSNPITPPPPPRPLHPTTTTKPPSFLGENEINKQ